MGEIALERTARRTGAPRQEAATRAARATWAAAGRPATAGHVSAGHVSAGHVSAGHVSAGRAGWGGVRGSAVRGRPVSERAWRSRLTRRGRAVLAGLMLLGAVVAGTLFVLDLGGSAQAAGGAGTGRPGLAEVVVRPGDSLWTIALRAEPDADPRAVEQQIMRLNRLHGTGIQPGERLLVPAG